MTHAASLLAATPHGRLDDDATLDALDRENRALRAELDEVEPVISAAVLAATAFRLRDQDGLNDAMRMLVQATRLLEQARPA
ncbi:MAG: hypothetical protein ACREH6_02135 [Geminicoccaceae bacterium]